MCEGSNCGCGCTKSDWLCPPDEVNVREPAVVMLPDRNCGTMG